MAIVTSQADFNSHEIATTQVYIAGAATTVENLDFSATGPVAINAPNNSTIAGTEISSTAASTQLNADFGTGGEITFTTAAATNQAQWKAGTFQATNKVFVANNATGNHQWPGFSGTTPYVMVIPGCEFRTGGDFGGQLTNHFQAMATDGNDFTGVTFTNGSVITPFPAIPSVNVTYSPDSASDGAAFGPVGTPSYRRLMQPRTGNPTVRWGGDFGCDFRNWNTDVVTAFQIRGLAAAVTAVSWYILDGQFSDEWLTGANAIPNGAGYRISATQANLNNAGYVPTTIFMGRSFNPEYLDLVDGTAITDAVFDVGNVPVLLLPTATDVATEPTRQAATAGNNYIAAYPAGTRRNGIATIESQQTLQAAIDRIPIPQAARNYNTWSYTHRSFDAAGDTFQSAATSGTWTSQMVLDNTAAGIQSFRIQNDDALLTVAGTLLTQIAADQLVINGSGDIRNAYAMAKWQYHNDRVPSFILSATADNLNPVIDGNFIFNENANSISAAEFQMHATSPVDLMTGSLQATNIGAISATGITVQNGTLRAATTLDLTAIDLAQGVTIDGGTVINIADADFADSVTLVNTPVLNTGGVDRDIRAWVSTGQATIVANAPSTITVTPDQNTMFAAGNNVTFNIVQPVVNVTISPGVSEAFLQANMGFWRVYNVSTGAFVTNGNVDITGTTTLADVTVSFVNTDTTQYRAIYQPLSSLTGGETFREGNQLWTPNTDGNATVTPNNDTALTGGTATDRTSDITFAVTGAGTTSNAISLVFAVTGALNNIQAREFALAARNNVSYINAIYDRRLAGNQPIIEFQQPFVTSYNGQEGSTAGAAIQQVYTIAPSDNIGSQTGMASTIGYIPGNNSGGFSFFSPQQINISASIPDVITAIDSSNTGTRVSDIDNKTSYLVTDGSDSTTGTVPTTTDSRLVGIKPKNAEYNRDANYVTNT